MNIQDIASRLLDEYDAHTPGRVFQNVDLDLSIADAYRVQFEVAALRCQRGERIAGYKIGCISQTMQKQLGISNPVFGHVWESELYPSGVELNAGEFDSLAIEGEIAVRLGDDVASSRWLRANPDVLAEYVPVIELHNYVLYGPEEKRAAELIANNAIHAGVVISRDHGSKRFNPDAVLQVDRNSERIGEGVATHLQDGVIEIVAAVAEHLASYGQQLKRDQLILTGSPLPLWRVAPADRITVRCEGLPDVMGTIANKT